MLPFREGLGKDISNLVISRYILQLHCSSLNPITDEVIPDLNVLWPIVKHWIIIELNATLIIAINDSRSKMSTKQPHQQLAKPNSLTTSLTCYHVLRLCRAQRRWLLLPAEPGNNRQPQSKTTRTSALPVTSTTFLVRIWVPHKSKSISPNIMQSIVYHTCNVPHHMFRGDPVHSSWLHHELIESVHCKTQIWSSANQIQQGPYQLTI